MNFLAHALLAGDADADQVGGLLGDAVKGPLPAGLPPDLASGVALHRAIDGFADKHPAFIASRARISPLRRRVGGILVDLFYDHLLAHDWAIHGIGTLDDYVERLHAALAAHSPSLPEKAREMGERMRTNGWLRSYRNVDAVGRVIDRMAVYRLRRANTLAGGIEEFLADAEGFATDFREFLPDVLAFSAGWRMNRLRQLSGTIAQDRPNV